MRICKQIDGGGGDLSGLSARIRIGDVRTHAWVVRLVAPLSLTHARARACRCWATLALAIIKQRARNVHVRAAPVAATYVPACIPVHTCRVRACVATASVIFNTRSTSPARHDDDERCSRLSIYCETWKPTRSHSQSPSAAPCDAKNCEMR